MSIGYLYSIIPQIIITTIRLLASLVSPSGSSASNNCKLAMFIMASAMRSRVTHTKISYHGVRVLIHRSLLKDPLGDSEHIQYCHIF